MRNFQTSRGFTLLEMALVVTIIGLLVGGIVGSRAYLRNAQLNTMMNEAKFFISQFNQFQNQYNAVPGDMANASSNWSGAHDGDGNGQILSSHDAGAAALPEIFYAWEHLSKSGLIAGNYTGNSGGAVGTTLYARAGTNLPASSVSGVAYLLDHPPYINGVVPSADPFYWNSTGPPNSGLYAHVLRVAAVADNASALPAQTFLTSKEAYQIDDKYDDGSPTTGWILATKLANCGQFTLYTINTKGPQCLLILRIKG